MKVWQFLLVLGSVVFVGVYYYNRRAIAFRFTFDMWPSEIGAGRIVRRRLREIDNDYAEAQNAAVNAKNKYDSCVSFVDEIRQAGKVLRRANHACDKLNSRYRKAAALANSLGFAGEVREVGLTPPSESRLRVVDKSEKKLTGAMGEI